MSEADRILFFLLYLSYSILNNMVMSQYQECKLIFEEAIDFLNSNSYSDEQFFNVIKELNKGMRNQKRVVTILLCTFLQDYCFNYKLDRAYSGRQENYDRRRPFRTTQEELAHIIQSLQGGCANDYTDDLKRIAREMSELVYERGWENNPY